MIWLPEAIRDIDRLYDFLSDKNPQAARNAVLCIQAAAWKTFPKSAGSWPTDHREGFAAFGAGAYVLRYRLDAGRQPVVIRVWHTREWRGG